MTNKRTISLKYNTFSMDKFREEVRQEDQAAVKKKASLDPSSRGYGGKFGVESDRMDKSALGKDINLFMYICVSLKMLRYW